MAVKKQYQVVIVGTGISAIAAAVSLRSRGIDDFIMVEKVRHKYLFPGTG